MEPHKHKKHEGQSLGMLVARYPFLQTGDKLFNVANFIYSMVLERTDCATQQMDIIVVRKDEQMMDEGIN